MNSGESSPSEKPKTQRFSEKFTKPLITAFALVLLLIHRFGDKPFDTQALGLIAIAVLPWLAGILESAELFGSKLQFRDIKREQELQKAELNWIKRMVSFAVSDLERTHLRSLAAEGPFMANVQKDSGFEWELRHLMALDFVGRQPDHGIRTLFAENGTRNVKEHLTITPRGREYLRIYAETVAPE